MLRFDRKDKAEKERLRMRLRAQEETEDRMCAEAEPKTLQGTGRRQKTVINVTGRGDTRAVFKDE